MRIGWTGWGGRGGVSTLAKMVWGTKGKVQNKKKLNLNEICFIWVRPKKIHFLCLVRKGGGGGQAKKNVSFRGAGGGGGGKGPSELKYVSFYFFILYFPLRGGKKYGVFLFRKNSERGGGLVQSKISLSKKNENFWIFFSSKWI